MSKTDQGKAALAPQPPAMTREEAIAYLMPNPLTSDNATVARTAGKLRQAVQAIAPASRPEPAAVDAAPRPDSIKEAQAVLQWLSDRAVGMTSAIAIQEIAYAMDRVAARRMVEK